MLRVLPHRAFIEPKASLAAVEAQAGDTTARLRIDGLLCSACATNVRGRLERLDGVRSARVDLNRGEAAVTYDAARIEPAALVEAVEGAVIFRPARRLLAKLARHGA